MFTILYAIYLATYFHTGYLLMAVAIDATADESMRTEAIVKLEFYPFYVRMCYPNLVTLTEDRSVSWHLSWLVLYTYSHAEIVDMLCSSSKTKKFHTIFSVDIIAYYNKIDQKYATPFEPFVRERIANDSQHRGEAMTLLEKIGCLKPVDGILFHVYLLFGSFHERCAGVVSLHKAGYRNHLLVSSAITLLPLAEHAGDKMDLLDCLSDYGMLAKNALPSARKLLHDGHEGVRTDAVWLLQALGHHAIRAVPELVELSLVLPRNYPEQQARNAYLSIIKSWISYVQRGAGFL